MSEPRIYYQSDLMTLWHGDCMDVLPTIKDKTVDLVVTDPPYGVKWVSGRRTKRLEALMGDDGSLDVEAMLALAAYPLKGNRHLYAFGQDAWECRFPLTAKAELVWDKDHMGSGDLSSPWGPSHERITFAVRVGSKGRRSIAIELDEKRCEAAKNRIVAVEDWLDQLQGP